MFGRLILSLIEAILPGHHWKEKRYHAEQNQDTHTVPIVLKSQLEFAPGPHG
jgi:hypothetical protein